VLSKFTAQQPTEPVFEVSLPLVRGLCPRVHS